MGRKKSRAVRATRAGAAAEADSGAPSPSGGRTKRSAPKGDVRVEVDRRTWGLPDGDHRDVAEVVLRDVSVSGEGEQALELEEMHRASWLSLRLLVRDAPEEGFRIGNWPVVPSDCVLLEYVVDGGDHEGSGVVLSGCFDGPDEGVSGLAHLVSLRFVTLRIQSFRAFRYMEDEVRIESFRVRVEMMDQAFAGCESLLEVSRHPWRKSLMNMMAWLRPEVTTSAAIYGTDGLVLSMDADANAAPKSDSQFDLAAFYEAVKPSV